MPKRAARRLKFRVAGSIAALASLAGAAACHRSEVPLTCPPGAALMGAPPPAGEEVWCQKMVNGKPVKDGIFVVYGTGTDRMIEGYYRDGVQEGEWTTWYENGQRSAVDNYRHGRQDGLHTSWYANGVKALEGQYREGKREGVWTRWDPTGFTSRQEIYRDDRRVDQNPKGAAPG
jgi:MORN repeat protein